VIQLFSVLEFSKDDASDAGSVVKVFEQSITRSSCINIEAVSVELLTEMLEALLKHLADHHTKIQNQDHDSIVTKLLHEMKLFFKMKDFDS
jgi:hypothetical protein